jgi:hypothetical protein
VIAPLSSCCDAAMSPSGQNPLLPHCNIDGRFSSVNRHALRRPRALPAGFIAPCLPTKAPHPPSGGQSCTRSSMTASGLSPQERQTSEALQPARQRSDLALQKPRLIFPLGKAPLIELGGYPSQNAPAAFLRARFVGSKLVLRQSPTPAPPDRPQAARSLQRYLRARSLAACNPADVSRCQRRSPDRGRNSICTLPTACIEAETRQL